MGSLIGHLFGHLYGESGFNHCCHRLADYFTAITRYSGSRYLDYHRIYTDDDDTSGSSRPIGRFVWKGQALQFWFCHLYRRFVALRFIKNRRGISGFQISTRRGGGITVCERRSDYYRCISCRRVGDGIGYQRHGSEPRGYCRLYTRRGDDNLFRVAVNILA